VLHGVELEVRSDGTLDYPSEWLARFDFIGASAHSGLGQPAEKYTERVIRALRNPYVTVLNHPTGRLLNGRPGAAIDLERVIAVAAAEGVALEINGSPDRLDLDDLWSRRAAAAGVLIACGSDAHSVESLANTRLAVAVARRGWLEPRNVLNARTLAELLEFRDRRRERRAA
jgi:DNA polymerase (family 10)